MLVDMQIDLMGKLMTMEQDTVGSPLNRSREPQEGLQWTGSQMELVELIYAMHAAKCFNHGTVSLKKLFAAIGEAFGMNVEKFSIYFTSIKNRVKGDRTKFLNMLKRALILKMEEADRKAPQK
jgi:hypothetical protein